MALSAIDAWDRLLRLAKDKVSEQTFRTWLEPAVPQEFRDSKLIVKVADQFAVDWNEKKHTELLISLAPMALGEPCEVQFRADEERQERAPQMDLFSAKPKAVPQKLPERRPVLSSRYTFDQFVIGKSNEVAATTALAAAQAPGKVYNPLFIYGPTGIGKTHLMQAVAHEIQSADPSLRITYLGAEQFTNEYILAIKHNTTREFRRRFRESDLLLVDDVQFLRNKEATQEEFFHTFNALYEAGRQIVLTSDRAPSELAGLEKRLVSRFEWGMVADIDLPDLELRIAILRKKAELDQLQRSIPDDVIRFLAEHIRSNVRELESSMIRLLAYSSLKKRDITIAVTQEALRDKLRKSVNGELNELPAITPERIQNAVAAEWGISADGLRSKVRTKTLTIPRQAAMLLCRQLLGLQLIEIGKAFGGRDHSTVIHSLERANDQYLTEPAFRSKFDSAKTVLTS